MKLSELLAAIDLLKKPPPIADLRSTAYLATYPALLATASDTGSDPWPWFCRIAVMTYGWMPRVVRLDMEHAKAAAESLLSAHGVTADGMREIEISPIASSVRSIVGASKMLHFCNPNVFPIWDSRIETFRLRKSPGITHMSTAANYWRYCEDVHSVRAHGDFKAFHAEMQFALASRLRHFEIEPYAISEVRAVELAAFELSAARDDA